MVALSTVFPHGYQSLSRSYGSCSLFKRALPFGWPIISGRTKHTVRQCSNLDPTQVPMKKTINWSILPRKKSLIRTWYTVTRSWSLCDISRLFTQFIVRTITKQSSHNDLWYKVFHFPLKSFDSKVRPKHRVILSFLVLYAAFLALVGDFFIDVYFLHGLSTDQLIDIKYIHFEYKARIFIGYKTDRFNHYVVKFI